MSNTNINTKVMPWTAMMILTMQRKMKMGMSHTQTMDLLNYGMEDV